ncbi:MAG: hypothetical protein A3E87_02610 [Gammaproteobacteria bacterium RIFCSPHIGHO2_12_FULL_35_23]|nr:MAG: hypothetical protein A3E87_02610 [Gammaproteobacteria bacterium RIFCSPHIGHO2_12_FULL_35_23]
MTNISPDELKELLTNPTEIVVIDVRESWERENNYIQNSVHIPLGELETSLPNLEKEKLIVTYCAHGIRSQTACEILLQHGFKNVKSLQGGFAAYQAL